MSKPEIKTAEDLVGAMALRARELSNQKIDELRYAVGTADTYSGAIAESKFKTKGVLIEEILMEEFEDAAKQLDERER